MAFTEVFPSIHIYMYIYTRGTFFSPPFQSLYMASKNNSTFAVFASWYFCVKF